MLTEVKSIRLFAILLFLFIVSCAPEDPDGPFKGYVKDWVYEVFEGTLTSEGEDSQLRVVLKNTPAGMFSEIVFRQPGKDEVVRSGEWEVDDGKRVLLFPDGDVREYYLIKRGARFAFQTKHGLCNDDGSPVLLMRNEGLSRKESYPLSFDFIDAEEVFVRGGGIERNLKGQWNWASGRVVVVVKLPLVKNTEAKGQSSESYKYFLRWSDNAPGELELEKMVILRPFLKEDRSKEQSWMSSLIFTELPDLSRIESSRPLFQRFDVLTQWS